MLITLNQLKKSLQALKDFLLAKITVKDVQINGTSVLDEGVANVPIASAAILGVVKSSGEGIQIDSSTGDIYTQKANPDDVKAGTNRYKVIVPQNQNEATFYGLAKASGDTTQSASSNAVGTYTDDAKTSIKTMLGVEEPVDVQINGTSIVNEGVANIPKASSSTFGVIKAGTDFGTNVNANGVLYLYTAGEATIKSGSHSYQAIPPSRQHRSVFYGLAKAAGHDEKDSTLELGTYSEEAKTAIQTMLGVDTAIADAVAGVTVDSIPTTEIDTLFA